MIDYLSPTVLQVVGLACVVVAAFMIYDGWKALGVFGLALIAVAEFTARRSPP